ncbi:hypothetical protein M3M39_02965 [Fructilactobacillus hinvesii]|uniref:Uncharacterized protein n=1 Tax=Fructilactobacillus hinvesii TaxID=2940300 RepID=A0ABY5BTJ6_9LACO|nr:hypothetical protein [Fructilactobacillus hinvesii]USS88450.1 hypothetical protein M3M39_02965 [Fructilactobacillus hinvesii]
MSRIPRGMVDVNCSSVFLLKEEEYDDANFLVLLWLLLWFIFAGGGKPDDCGRILGDEPVTLSVLSMPVTLVGVIPRLKFLLATRTVSNMSPLVTVVTTSLGTDGWLVFLAKSPR